MNNSDHIHRFSLLAWVFHTLLGSFFLLLVLSVLMVKGQDLISARSGFSDYLGIALMVFLLLPSGLLLLILPFVIKIVVTRNGLEYHSAIYVLNTDWKDLVNVGYVESTLAGKTFVVVPQGGKLKLRSWTAPFQSIMVKRPQDIQILVSQFGTANGHSFETDILVNVHQHTQFSNGVEHP